jgi:hypothetical protein
VIVLKEEEKEEDEEEKKERMSKVVLRVRWVVSIIRNIFFSLQLQKHMGRRWFN